METAASRSCRWVGMKVGGVGARGIEQQEEEEEKGIAEQQNLMRRPTTRDSENGLQKMSEKLKFATKAQEAPERLVKGEEVWGRR